MVALLGFGDREPPGTALALLGDAGARYGAARAPWLRRRLAATRWLARTCAGAVLGLPPARVPLATGPHGRPVLTGSGWDVSISHTRAAILVALADGRRVGADLEPTGRGRDLAGLEDAVCCPAELRWWQALPPGERAGFLLRRWTLKEAHGKAVGLGLGLRFDGYGFRWCAGRPRRTDDRGRPLAATGWTYRSLPVRGLGLIGLALGPPSR